MIAERHASNSPNSEDSPRFGDRLRTFFFTEEVPYGVALVRMVLPLVLCIDVIRRWGFARELYSTDGSPAQLSLTYGWGHLMPELPGTMVVALFTALLFFLVTTSIGWCTRFSVSAVFVLYTYFSLLDSISTVTKYTVIASHLLLLLAVSRCGAVWSVDAWLAGRRRNHWPGQPAIERPTYAVWPRRLMQLLLGFIYFGAAITKMHTPAFFSGDQLLFWVNTHVNHSHPVGEYFTLYPWLLSIMAYVSIVWELLFVFLCWRGLGRRTMLTMGVAFHLGTTLILGLIIFPMVSIAAYLCFVNERDVQWGARIVRRLRRRFPGRGATPASVVRRDWRNAIPVALRFPAPVAFALATVGIAVAGVQAEHVADPYGRRRPEGPHELRPMETERVRELLLTGTGRIEPADKLWAFDLGTTTLGGILVDRRDTFEQGACILAQCTFTPPHEDMWIQCDLHDLVTDHEGRFVVDQRTGKPKLGAIIDEQGGAVERNTLRYNFGLTLARALEPGRYALVVKSRGGELSRRTFTVVPDRD
jgi:hypothetical protein